MSGHPHPIDHPEIRHALASRNAGRFARAILPQVSRTFALGIRVLSGKLGHAVLDAYLLCRILDTVEDAPSIDAQQKATLLDEFVAALEDRTALARFCGHARTLGGDPAHLVLAANADLVLEHFAQLPDATRNVVTPWVIEMAMGMRKFVLLYPSGIRIQTVEEYREYCYYVAGTVGYMLTDLWHAHASSIDAKRHAVLRERCRAFAEALQTVNILKDVAADAEQENSVYIPEELLRAQGSTHGSILAPELVAQNREALSHLVQLAWHDLDEARNYLLLIPRRAVSIRLFCLLPLVLAYATMRDLVRSTAMLRPGGSVKISRREVKSLLMTTSVVVMSNAAVRWLIDRVRVKEFA